jgi:selenophosphate synthetase-related protein
MGLDLAALTSKIRAYPGLTRKQPIEEVFAELGATLSFGPQLPNYGDDAAVIPWEGNYLLLAADGIMTGLLREEPYAAGKAAVMAAVNDIYSMGGKPLAMVNVLAHGEAGLRNEVVRGIRRGCEKFKVPMVGGHLHPDPPKEAPALSVAILGWARQVLRSHLARPGEDLIIGLDLSGRPGCKSVLSWDANSGKTPEELLYRLEALPLIAERKWAFAAKDISNAGILGTLAIMMENSGHGAVVELEAIPVPGGMDFQDWMLAFQSYGFVLSVPPDNSNPICRLFQERGIAAAVVGKVAAEPRVILKWGSASHLLFDFDSDKITGIRYNPR